MFILWEGDKMWNIQSKTTSNRKKKNVARCLKCLEKVREEFEQYMTNKKNKKDNYSSFPEFGGLENIVDIDEEKELEEVNLHGKKVIDNKKKWHGK